MSARPTAGTVEELFLLITVAAARVRTRTPPGVWRHLSAFCLFSSSAALDRGSLVDF